MKPASPVALFAFLFTRSLFGAARRRLRRLKEPRYLLGTALAVLYFVAVFVRPGRSGTHAAAGIGELPPSVSIAASFALTAIACLSWILRSSRAALPLSETEAQFLFPAPLGRRAVVRFALLRVQLAILFGALVLSFVFRRGSVSSFFLAWAMLATLNLHGQGISFTKARLNESRARVPLLAAVWAASLAVLALASVPLLSALGGAALPLPLVRAGEALLFPARLLVTPMLTLHGHAPLAAWLGVLALVLVHFLWVDLSATKYEEATLAQASRRAEMRRRQGVRLTLPAEAGRRNAPFPLAPTGAPEVAILWKNLLAVRRTPLRTQALLIGSLLLVLFAGSAALVATHPDRHLEVQIGVLTAFGLALLVAFLSPFVQREDFRSDLLMADVLRTWPVAPVRIAAGELAAPLATTAVRLGAGLLAAAALSLGGAAGLRLSRTLVAFPQRQEIVDIARPASILPWLAASAVFILPLAALLLALQNAATLAFPAWFPPGPRRTGGPEMTGMRMLSALGTFLLVGLALIPAALVAGIAAFLGRGLGFRFLPALAPVAALPLALEAGALVWVLGKLLERHDPALDAGP